MAKVTALMTEPSSKTPLVILFIWSLLKFLFSSFGLKSGSEARASTSPVVMSITMPPPAMARNFAIDLRELVDQAACTRMSIDICAGSVLCSLGSASEAV